VRSCSIRGCEAGSGSDFSRSPSSPWLCRTRPARRRGEVHDAPAPPRQVVAPGSRAGSVTRDAGTVPSPWTAALLRSLMLGRVSGTLGTPYCAPYVIMAAFGKETRSGIRPPGWPTNTCGHLARRAKPSGASAWVTPPGTARRGPGSGAGGSRGGQAGWFQATRCETPDHPPKSVAPSPSGKNRLRTYSERSCGTTSGR
jgi:hypothetical protein